MPKYWGKEIFAHVRFPEKVGQKQKREKKKKKKRPKISKMEKREKEKPKVVITMASYA